MRPSSSSLRYFCPALLVMALAGPARAADLQNLLQTSPFAPVPVANAPGQASTSLEFRGVFADKGEYFFSLYEAATRRSLWVGLNEPGNPFTVRAYDPASETVTAEYQGRTLPLTLKTAKILVSAPAPLPPVAGVPGTALAQPAAPAGTPEAQIVEEIRRRRALRQQSAAGTAPAGPPASAAKPAPKQQP